MRRSKLLVGLLGAFAVAAPTVGFALAGTNDSGISGRIQEGPTCPVERAGADCAPKPLSARVGIHRVGERYPVVIARSTSTGRLDVALAPGEYVLRPLRVHNRTFPRPPPPSRVQVADGRFTRVTITYDTGIR